MRAAETAGAGCLYLVGTPIGNLGDMTLRALETLKNADFIACEDTRVTRKLLTHFDIHAELLSYYEHNRRESGEGIIARLLRGENGCLVTDAGMPVVSDPGESLVALCREAGVKVCAVPGPCAAVSALALSGLAAGRFCFEGFLSVSRKSRNEHLSALALEPRTMVFYEAPHKLLNTLKDFRDTFGPERRIIVCREMTKLYEEALEFTLSEALAHFAETPPRGEFTLVLEGAVPVPAPAAEDTLEKAREFLATGMSLRDAAKRAAELTGANRREIYNALTHELIQESAKRSL